MPRIAADQREALEAARRDQILDAAIGLWLADGFDATSVSRIAGAAGLAKGTVYLYFRSKEDLLDAAISRYSLLPDLEALLAAMAGAPLADALPALVRAVWLGLKQRTAIVQLFVRELSVRPQHAREFIERVVLPTNRMIAGHLDQRIQAGEMRQVDSFVSVRALIGMIVLMLFTQEIFGGKELSPLTDEQITGTISDLFLRGVLAGEGER